MLRLVNLVKYGKKVKVEIIILISILVLGCLLFFLFIQDGGITGHVVKEDDKKIQIGVLIPLTGKYASLGEQVRYGYEIAVFDFNINSDYKLNLIYEDTGSDINKAITGAQKLLNVDKVNILLGPFSSGAVLAIAPTTELAQKILFTPIASSSEITHAG